MGVVYWVKLPCNVTVKKLAIWKFDISMNGKISGASLRKILSFATCGLVEDFWCKIEKKGFCSDIWEIVEFRSSKSFYFFKISQSISK